jgi:acyl-CoA thioester hydrolase
MKLQQLLQKSDTKTNSDCPLTKVPLHKTGGIYFCSKRGIAFTFAPKNNITMQEFIQKVEIRWADIDPNFHVLHSKYYDFCATARMKVLEENGISMEAIQQYHIGPVILREECIFKRELKFHDTIEIRIRLRKAEAGYKRWSFINEIWKNGDILAAVVTVDGGWLDTKRRKLAIPPEIFQKAFDAIPKASDFNQ